MQCYLEKYSNSTARILIEWIGFENGIKYGTPY